MVRSESVWRSHLSTWQYLYKIRYLSIQTNCRFSDEYKLRTACGRFVFVLLWKRLCLFGLCLFRFVGCLFLLGSGKGCGLWLWHSLDFSLTLFFIMSISEEKKTEVIEDFSSTSRFLDDLLKIDNNYFDGLINHNYPSELQLNKANSSETEAPFLDLH